MVSRVYTDLEIRKENMLATLEMIKEKYGGAEEYVRRKCGLEDEDLEKIKINLLAR